MLGVLLYHPDNKAIELGWVGGLKQFTDGDFKLYRNMYKQTIKSAGCLTSFLSQMLVTYHLVRDHSAFIDICKYCKFNPQVVCGVFLT